MNFRLLESQEQVKLKISRQKEINEVWAEINDRETKNCKD
jgi:hypothetical protein